MSEQDDAGDAEHVSPKSGGRLTRAAGDVRIVAAAVAAVAAAVFALTKLLGGGGEVPTNSPTVAAAPPANVTANHGQTLVNSGNITGSAVSFGGNASVRDDPAPRPR